MKASETKLQPVLEGSKQYFIPLFQRHYSWKKQHWETLWNDLIEVYEARDVREHFLGAIVTMPVDMQPHGVAKFLLIDGQQRLTTLFILLAALRDSAAKQEYATKLPEQISEQYLINKWEEGFNAYKLLPTQSDREVFFHVLDNTVSGTSRIAQAYRYFMRELQGHDEQGKPYDLQRLLDVLVQRFVVVSIVLAKDENPYLIFESLNAKGQPLTQADLVRNFLFMQIDDPAEQSLAYKELWHPIELDLEDGLTDFLWRYLTKDGAFVRQGSIYEAIKSKLTNLPGTRRVVDELSDMHTYAGYYKRLVDPESEPNEAIRLRLLRLNRWEVKTSYPFLLALYHDFATRAITVEEFCEVLDTIESYVVRRFFCRVPTNALNRIFIGLNRLVDRDNLVASVQRELLVRNWPADELFTDGLLNFPIYSSGTQKTRHILESLETKLTLNNEPVDIGHPRITIEHIMPQTLNEAWEQELGGHAAETYERYLHSLGNLTLTGMNEPMGNAPFPVKRVTFRESNFALNHFVAEQEGWDQAVIISRAVLLASLAKRIWRRPDVAEISDQQEDPTGRKPTRFRLLGEDYYVQTWREMFLKGTEVLVNHHGVTEFMKRTANVVGSKRRYVAYSSEGMTSALPLGDTGLWVETNLGSRGILSILNHLLVACGHEESEFEAYWV